ncbi:MAG TPA: c-type cytochrome [Longimicrobiales bacterium]|nr:c-type cytochrome [Longimicrobiales bacterium]
MTKAFHAAVLAAAYLLGTGELAAQQTRAPLSTFQRAKLEALLDTRLPCLGCHVVNGRGGRIGPDLSGVGARLDATGIRQQILNPRGIMPRIPLPPGTRDLLVAYLAEQRNASASQQTGAPAFAPSQNRAEQLYRTHCAACHGIEGKGDGWNAAQLDRPPARHADARAMGARTDDRLYDAIHAGSVIMGGSARMPPFGHTLSAQDIRLLVGYIRQLCRCRQPGWADGQG